MTEQTKQEAGKEAALADLAKIKKRHGRPKGAAKGLPTWLGAEPAEVTPKDAAQNSTADPSPKFSVVKGGADRLRTEDEIALEEVRRKIEPWRGLPLQASDLKVAKRGPGRPKKVVVEPSQEAVPAKRGPGRPPKTATPEVGKRGPGRPKGKPGRPRKVVAEAPKRGRKPKEGSLLADYIKRDEALRLAQDAAAQAVAEVYARLPKLIEKELKRLLR